MPWTHDIGPLYWHTIRYPERILGREHWRATTHEVEWPYRLGRGVALPWGRRRVLVLGKWHRVERTEDEALQAALGASPVKADTETIKEWDRGAGPAQAGAGGDEGGTAYRVVADPRATASG